MSHEKEYRIRTLRIPITGAGPEVYRDLRESQRLATQAANYVLTKCAAADQTAWLPAAATGEDRGRRNLPPCPKLYFYSDVAKEFPGVSTVAANIAREAEATYRQFRFDIICGKATLPIIRSHPWPVLHNQSSCGINLEADEQGNVWANLKLLGGWHRLQLRGGSNYARQLAPLKKWIAARDLDRIRDSKVWLDRRGQIVIGVAVRFDATEPREPAGSLLVRTARESLIVASRDTDDIPFVINADHVRGWQTQRARRMERLRQDRKAGASRRHLDNRMDIEGRKHRDRVQSFIYETAAHIVSHAQRRRVAEIKYDDTIRSYFENFPWFNLKKRLQEKCEDAGIQFVECGSGVTPPSFDEPHVYFQLAVDLESRRSAGRVKIGMTVRPHGERSRSLEAQGGHGLTLLAADKQPKSGLRKREREYHSQFAEHRIEGEWFRAEPVISWLRETGTLGNMGNLAEIAQYLDV